MVFEPQGLKEIIANHTVVKDELESIYLDKIKGSVICSRAEFIEHNEKGQRLVST